MGMKKTKLSKKKQALEAKQWQIMQKYNKVFAELKSPPNSFERVCDNLEVVANMNYEIVQNGGNPVFYTSGNIMEIMVTLVKTIQELKNK